MVRRSLAASLTACLLVACSGGTDTPDAGEPTPDPAFWGLGDDRCLRYADGQGRLRYTVEVSADTTTLPGVQAFELRHKWQGFLQRTDLVEVTADSVVLHRRTTGALSGQDTLFRYDPPPVLLQKGLDTNPVETTTQARISGSVTADEQQTFRVIPQGEEPIEGPSGPVAAQSLTQSIETPSETIVERLWFAPNVGIVKLDPAGSTVEEVTLKENNAIPAGEGCLSE